MAAPIFYDGSLHTTSHNELQLQPQSQSLSSFLPRFLPQNDQTPTTLIPAPCSDHRRLPKRVLQVANSGSNAGQIWEPESSWMSYPHPQLSPSSLSLPSHVEFAPKAAQFQPMKYLFDCTNCESGIIDVEELPLYMEQFSIELLHLLSTRKEKTLQLPSKTHKGHVAGLAKWISIPTRLSHRFGTSKYSKRVKLYHYVRRRGIDFLAGQFQTLQQCLIEGVGSSSEMAHERSLTRKIAEGHPNRAQIARAYTLVKRCMSIDFKQVIVTKDYRELVRAVCILTQFWTPE